MAKNLLAGIRIVDLTHFRSGPSGTSLLGGMGAEVVKIEAIQRFDGFRSYNTSDPMNPDFFEMGSYFNAANTNKLGITLDLRTARAKEIFLELVRKSDVVIENFSANVMRNFGLEYDKLKEVNPEIIMVSMSCFGQTGPWRDYLGFGYVFDQVGGAAAVSGYEGGPPTHMMAASDVTAGIFAAYGVLLAFQERKRTGLGQFIDMSQVETLAYLLGPQIIDYQLSGRVQPRMGNRHPAFSPHGVYPCRGNDEWVTIAIKSDVQWAALATAMDKPAWVTDERFATVLARKQNEQKINEVVTQWTRPQDKRTVMEALQALGIAAAAVLRPMELLDDPQFEARGIHKRITREFVGEHRYPQFPLRFSDAICEQRTPAPTLGQHNDEVLGGLLGIEAEELECLRQQKIIGTRPVGW